MWFGIKFHKHTSKLREQENLESCVMIKQNTWWAARIIGLINKHRNKAESSEVNMVLQLCEQIVQQFKEFIFSM